MVDDRGAVGVLDGAPVVEAVENGFVDTAVDEPVGRVRWADVGVIVVGLDLEEPRQGVEGRGQQDGTDEAARTDLVLEPEEGSTEHDVPKSCKN